MKKKLKGIMVLFVGIILLMMGMFASIVPFVPGWVLIALGILCLTLYFPRLRNWVDGHTVRWPHLHNLIHRARMWADRNIGEL